MWCHPLILRSGRCGVFIVFGLLVIRVDSFKRFIVESNEKGRQVKRKKTLH